MTLEQVEAREAILKVLLALPEIERADVFASVQHNGVFCCACGRGSATAPNGNCQCANDE